MINFLLNAELAFQQMSFATIMDVHQMSQQKVPICRRAPQNHSYLQKMVAVWCSGSALVTINVVILHRARLVLGWVRTPFAPSRF